jgi:tripartite-type tricarboxylate transporter receptor subunit TctC
MTSPKFQRRTLLNAASLIACTVPIARIAAAQNVETTRFVNGAPAGGALDTLCRQVADHIQPGYSRNAIVENRTGGAGQIAVTYVKVAAPDGSTVLCTPMPQLGIYPHTYKKLPYDPQEDLAAVSMGAAFDLAIAVGPAIPAAVTTVPEFLRWCKANPGRANFGSPAAGSTPHFVGMLLGRAGNVELSHIAFRGTPPAVMDMVGGQIQSVVAGVGDFLQFVEAGKCRLLATTGAKRSKFAPNVPTLIEQGYSGMEFSDWFGFFVPANTRPAQVERLSAAIRTALARQDVIKTLALKGLDARSSTPQQLQAALRADTVRWGPIVKSIGFTADS